MNFVDKLEELKLQEFNIKDGNIAGDDVVLISPKHMGVTWNRDNVIYRSSMWTKDGLPVSLSFKKFVNWGEKPDLFPLPKNLNHSIAIEKMDGSLLCISKYKGQLITRTRGTIDARELDTGNEIDILVKKYPKMFDSSILNSGDYSIICEWLSPKNVIVIKYSDEPELVLIGVIKHSDYRYMTQNTLDEMAVAWEIKRPKQFKFNDIPNMLQSVKELKGQEGICLYYNDGQDILKIKSTEYLTKHAFKSNVSVDSIIEMFVEYSMPDYQTFMSILETDFDFECASMARGLVSKVVDAEKELQKIITHLYSFIEPLKTISRKDAAQAIISAYGKTFRAGLAFKFLDGKILVTDDYKKLLFQTIK